MLETKHVTHRWRTFLCVFLSGVVIAMNQYKVAPVSDLIIDLFSVSRAGCGLLTTSFSVAEAILIIPAAALFCRLGERKTTLLALSLSLLGTAIGGLTSSYAVLMVTRFAEGCGMALISVVLPAIPVRYFALGEQGLPTGLQAGYTSIAALVMFNLAVPLTSLIGAYSSLWLVNGGLTAVCFVVSALLITDSPGDAQNAGRTAYRAVMKNGLIWILGLCFFGISFRDLAYSSWTSDYFKNARQISASVSNLSTSLCYAGLWLGNFTSGLLLDRKVRGSRLIVLSGSLLLALGLLCYVVPSALIAPYMLVTGFSLGLGVPAVFLLVSSNCSSKNDASFAIAFINLFLYVGCFIAPTLSGAVIDRFGWNANTAVVEFASAIILFGGIL